VRGVQPTVLRIDLQRCINCSLCRRACPTEAINYFSTGHRTHVIDPAWCIGCDICAKVCPVDCIDEDPSYVPDPAQLEIAKERARAFAKRQHGIKLMRRQRTAAAISAVGPVGAHSRAPSTPQASAEPSTNAHA
jgi:Pyruvate/2-oxoacid:ferredoxin oxidoreductase delta subunit